MDSISYDFFEKVRFKYLEALKQNVGHVATCLLNTSNQVFI